MRKLTIMIPLLWALGLGAQSVELGLYGGLSTYAGDLTPGQFSVHPDDLHLAGGMFARLNVGDRLALRLSVMQTAVSGDDAHHDNPRNLNFRSDLTEAALVAEVQPFRLAMSDRSTVIPYAFGGVARFRFNPTSQFEGRTIELQPLGTEGQGLPGYDDPYQLNEWALPFGGGLKFELGDRWVLGVEVGMRYLFTDYLDDISYRTVNYLDLLQGNGDRAAALSNPNIDPATDNLDQTYRRGGESNDWYTTLGLTLSYRLPDSGGGGKNVKCYSF